MSLLTNPFFAAGSGLLASSGPSLQPVNPWGGITKGLLAANQARAYEQDMEANKMRLAMLRAQQDRLGRQDAYLAEQGPLAQLFPEQWAQSQFREPAEPPTGIQEYEFAKSQGYQGTYEDWKTSVARAGASQINMGDVRKPLGADSIKWRDNSGNSPSPMLTIEEAVEAGFNPVSDYEAKREARAATIDADRKELLAQKQRAEEGYAAAQEAFNSAPNASNKRKLDNAAAALRTAIAGLENWRGEPSEGVADRFTVPGAAGSVIEEGIDRLLGGGETPSISSDEEYDALPSGAVFVGPDGVERRKP